MPGNQVRIAADGGNVAKHQVESKLIPSVCPEGKVLDRCDVGCSCLLAVVVSMLSKYHRNMRVVVTALQLSWATMREALKSQHREGWSELTNVSVSSVTMPIP